MTKQLYGHCILVAFFVLFSSCSMIADAQRNYYEIRIYNFQGKQQEDKIENFLKTALLPAVHRAGIGRIGVFKPVATDTASFGKKIFLFIPYTSLGQFVALGATLDNDQELQEKGKEYLRSSFDAPPYRRFESILLQAFEKSQQAGFPSLTSPIKDRVYELRSYESATEKININKVKMFNDGDEIGLFKRLGFNAIFYAEVLAGSHMPNLMYMTCFNSMASRDEHWKSFGADPQWKALVAMPEYQHNVSKADIWLLHPAEYSDF